MIILIEIIWAETSRYAGKLIHIDAGHALSLQYHERKAESIYVLSGRLHLHLASGPKETVRVIELEVPDMYGRPWAQMWRKYWERDMQPPSENDIFSFE